MVPKSLRQKGEPRLGEYGIYRAYGESGHDADFQQAVMWVLNQADGDSDLDAIAARSGFPIEMIGKATDLLLQHGLIVRTTDGLGPQLERGSDSSRGTG